MTRTEDFNEALRRRLQEAGVSYRRLAELLPQVGMSRTKDTIALWVQGKQRMWPEEVFAVERVLGLPGGSLSRCQQPEGYLPTFVAPVVSPEQALRADGQLPSDFVDDIVELIKLRRRRTRRK